MYSSTQPGQRRFGAKFWKGDNKRRNSTPNPKKEEELSIITQSSLNYLADEQNKFLSAYTNARNDHTLHNERIILSIPLFEICNKLRVIRTIKIAEIDQLERNNPKLEPFYSSYSKDYVIYKSKYEGFNKAHLRNSYINNISLLQDIPIYDINMEINQESSPNHVLEQWADQSFSKIQSDPLLTGLLNNLSPELEERQSRRAREKSRQQKLFMLYNVQDYVQDIADKGSIDYPQEVVGKSFKITLKSFRLEPDLEPIFGHMSLYDLKNKKKISENFYFDFNSKTILTMLDEKTQLPFVERIPQPNSCIFHISHTSDIFLVLRIEKILQQGDANEIADSYLRDDKHKSKLKTEIEWAWRNHTKYRMPFGFIAIDLQTLISGNDKFLPTFQSSNSIDNCSLNSKTSVKSARMSVNVKRHPLESATIKSTSRSLSKDMYMLSSNMSDEDQFSCLYQSMITKNKHIENLYRQESDKMSEDDLFKWLLEYKKPGNIAKKLKIIPCHMDFEICPYDEMESSTLIFSPEEQPLATKHQNQRSSKQTNIDRPIIDILEFPAEKRFIANAIYRNLLYVYPKSVNFGSKQGSFRNIAIKTQIIHTDGDKMRVLQMIFYKSYGSKLTSEVYTKVLYHVKSPDFNDEIKIKLPAVVTGNIFLLFTFYHISCQASKKHDSDKADVIIGYSWLPLLDNNILRTSEHSLMISLERPTVITALKKPDLQNNLEEIKWLDAHKDLFRVYIQPVSTIHSEDSIIEQFNNITSFIRSLSKTSASKEDIISCKDSLFSAIKRLDNCPLDGLLQFSSVILDNLLWLSLNSSTHVFHEQPDINQHFLNVIATVVNRITVQSTNKSESLNRDAVLYTYVYYAASFPEIVKAESSETLDPEDQYASTGLFHEDLLSIILQCIENCSRDLFLGNIWFFLELLIRSMKEYYFKTSQIRSLNRNNIFSQNFQNKLNKLIKVSTDQLERYVQMKHIISEDSLNIISPQQIKDCQNLIRNLALFHNDLVTMINLTVIKCFILNFVKFINYKIVAESKETVALYIKCKLEFLMILSCSEYFLSLNGIDLQKKECVINSQITESYIMKHFLLGLVLTELKICLQTSDSVLQNVAIQIVLNLMASHEFDERYNNAESISIISDMYLPLINVLFESLKYLTPQRLSKTKLSLHICNDNCSISSIEYYCPRTSTEPQRSVISNSLYQSIEEEVDNSLWNGIYDCEDIDSESLNSKHLLLCFIWLMKNLDNQDLKTWFQNLSTFKINKVLHLILLSVVTFEYKGSKDNASYQSVSIDLAAPEEIKRETDNEPKVVAKDNIHSVMETILCREIIFVVLDTLEVILKVFESSPHASVITINILRIITRALCLNQSVDAIQSLLSFLRVFIKKHHKIIFDEYIDLCGDLCKCLLSLSGSELKEIRSHAVASLYILMRLNFQLDNTFARIKLQITMALSRLVCDTSNSKRKKNIEINLNKSLRTIIAYSSIETDLQNEQVNNEDGYVDYASFANQVDELTLNLHNILNDTVKMRQFQKDPEMQIDLMSRIAKGYQNSPDLRLAWLQMMMKKHRELNNKAEAGMCFAHCAGIVAEYLGMKEPLPYMPVGCVQLSDALGTNLLEESATSDDVVSPDEDGMCCDELFCQEGLIKLIQSAAIYFHKAGMYELIPKINKVVLPILEERQDYSRLSKFHDEIKAAYDNIIHNVNKRIFATYFRVGFYGKGFQDLDNQEYIYKELPYSKLPEISSKIESFYSARFGKDNLVIIKDSSNVDPSILDKNKNYIQIIFVEPFFETAELRRRVSTFDQNYNLRRFVYSTPYTLEGKSHGELKEQYKRKTILMTEKAFPYIKTRILVLKKYQIELTPIEVALEDLSKKVEQLSLILSQEPIDAKYLQMMLQGAIGTTVNQGPVELATSFLSKNNAKDHGYHHNKLTLCFNEFIRRCFEGLQKNRKLITIDQREYQNELEKNFNDISKQLAALMNNEDIVTI